MKEEYAIARLKLHLEWVFSEETVAAINMGINALEKQSPKKPIFEGDGYASDGTFVYDTWVCPCCEARYELDCDDYNFCQNCGQRIDWS